MLDILLLNKPVRVKFVNPDNLAEITPEMVRVYIQSTKTETITGLLGYVISILTIEYLDWS